MSEIFSTHEPNTSEQLLGAMQELIDNPFNVTQRCVENWKQVSCS
jgi:hypothetical protein